MSLEVSFPSFTYTISALIGIHLVQWVSYIKTQGLSLETLGIGAQCVL